MIESQPILFIRRLQKPFKNSESPFREAEMLEQVWPRAGRVVTMLTGTPPPRSWSGAGLLTPASAPAAAGTSAGAEAGPRPP